MCHYSSEARSLAALVQAGHSVDEIRTEISVTDKQEQFLRSVLDPHAVDRIKEERAQVLAEFNALLAAGYEPRRAGIMADRVAEIARSRQELVDRRAAGQSFEQIAAATGRSAASVRKSLTATNQRGSIL